MPEETAAQHFDAKRVEAYDDRIRRLFPGYDVLQDAVASVLATRLPETARLLVAGAGTGAEIVRMGEGHPQWRFVAVDPSPDMLDRCRARVAAADMDERVEYVCARVEDLPDVQTFDAATSLLVIHFIEDEAAKQRYFQSIADRLTPGAPLVWADLHRPEDDTAFRDLWAAWREEMGTQMATDEVERTFERIEEGISFISPPALERVVTAAGFAPPTQIYQHLLWGAWITQPS
jgi:tRNA (cmo5U34)-methyltransferase